MKEKKQRVIVKGFVQRNDKILLVKRKRENHEIDKHWELPGGKIDFGERMEDACVREVLEESGILTNFKKIEIEKYKNIFFKGDNYSHLILIPILLDYLGVDKSYKGDHNVYDVAWFSREDLKKIKLIKDNKDLIAEVLNWKLE